jgi:serine/threonine protein kinase
MFVSAPLRNEKNKIIGLLAFEIRPEKDFTQILTVARFGTSGETYAFDDTGVMLSDSRFDDELRQIGLIGDAPDARALLNVSIRDPGVNMVDGETTDTARNEQPLTRMAAAAIAMKTRSQRREDGSRPIEIDVNGYRDYRGVPVIGVWTWLPEYGFGVTTEVDVAEAYRPLWVLRMAFGVLLGLLVISAGGIWFSSHLITLLQRRVRRAVSEAKQLGQYRLEQKIGEGGMGEVYRASHAMLRRPTAVKVLRAERSSKQAIGRFEREVQLTAALTHPNTIAIYDYGHTPEGEFYYAMEFLDGIPLDTLVKEYGPQSEARVIHILLQVCASLEEAHNASLIHRDVKPANIMLCARGGQHDVAKVLDFGLVKDVRDENDPDVSNPNALTGTPLYMSPEAIDDPQTVEARSDLYLVGCVGYYLLTGQHVFDGKTAVQIYFQHSQAKPVPPSERMDRGIDEVLEKVILCCLEKDREQRPADARALQEMLLKCHAAGHWNRDEAADWWKTHTERIVDQDTVISPRGIRSTEAATAIDVVNRNDTTQDWPGGETA